HGLRHGLVLATLVLAAVLGPRAVADQARGQLTDATIAGKELSMRFGIFYEHQLPRPWEDGAELQLFQDALAQVELADRLGIDYAWEVEHHFLEEYSHSSAPEVFLAAASQRSRRIRLGHGIVLMPPGYNAPARVAERVATLDLVSGGRVDWGTGESASRAELEGFGIAPSERRAMWRETVEQVANMMVMDPYPGFTGKYFAMPARHVLPKPVQTPRRRRGRPARQRRLPLLPVRAGPPLRVRQAHTGPDQYLEPLPGAPRPDRHRGPGRGRRLHRHAGPAPRDPAHLPGGRRGPDH